MSEKLKFTKVRSVKSPNRGTQGSAGIDFFIPDDFPSLVLQHGESCLIPSGIKVRVPDNYALIAQNKSGIASKKCLDIMACVIDSDYQGEVHINLINNGNSLQELKAGDKIIQFLLTPISHCDVEEVSLEELYPIVSDRGEGGFGSTDNKPEEKTPWNTDRLGRIV